MPNRNLQKNRHDENSKDIGKLLYNEKNKNPAISGDLHYTYIVRSRNMVALKERKGHVRMPSECGVAGGCCESDGLQEMTVSERLSTTCRKMILSCFVHIARKNVESLEKLVVTGTSE
ncbi:uncharacterized protein LOC143923045 [Arctopsyche grandis]|uniref:uncharacterized protein LOC143923045 n=1 Tax=Arctopsyche grandis TaxID=121162 RepID=UPI00406D63C7